MNSSIKKGQDIATLVARLVYKTNIEMTVSHWIRIAFLVCTLLQELSSIDGCVATVFGRLQPIEEEGSCSL